MSSLYEISQQYLKLLQLIENGDIAEDAINDTIEAVVGDIDSKIDNIACYIKNLNAEALALKEESKRLIDRQKAKENKAEQLMQYLKAIMLQTGKGKFESNRNYIRFTKSTKVVLSPNFNNKEYMMEKTETVPDKMKIKYYLNEGKVIEGARLETDNNIHIK